MGLIGERWPFLAIARGAALLSSSCSRYFWEELKMKKIAMFLGASLIASTLIACGKNDCEDAADRYVARYEECGGEISNEDGGSSDGGSTECSEAAGKLAQCQADCRDEADCKLIVVDTANLPTAEETKAYADCLLACN